MGKARQRVDADWTPERVPASRRLLVAWLVGMAIVGFGVWLVNAIRIESRCDLFSTAKGGDANSLAAAAAIGVALWLAAGLVAWRLRSNLELLFLGFVAASVIALVVLSHLSPVIWGPMHCEGGLFDR